VNDEVTVRGRVPSCRSALAHRPLLGHASAVESDAPDVLTDVSTLIDAWCDRRDLRPLAQLLPAWLANNGLTDGWGDVLDALRSIRADDRLPDDEVALVERSIIAVERAVYRS